MNKTFLLIYLIINVCYSQNKISEVTYKRIINLNELPSHYTEKQKLLVKERYKNYDSLSYTLLFNKNESLFFLNDSVIGLYHEIEDNSLKIIIRNERRKKYYKNISENKILYQTVLGGETLIVTRKPNKIRWKIYNESRKIGIYNCFKAILFDSNNLLGYKDDLIIEAWFTPDIPLPFGPLQFEGLPGLILELKLGRNIYYASHINLNSNKAIQPLKEEGKVITQEAYKSYLNDFVEQILKN